MTLVILGNRVQYRTVSQDFHNSENIEAYNIKGTGVENLLYTISYGPYSNEIKLIIRFSKYLFSDMSIFISY